MKLKGIVDTDVTNYKKLSMFLIFTRCSFKCDLENGTNYCQNRSLVKNPNVDISCEELYTRYINNPMTDAIVCGGLEPFDTFEDLLDLIKYFREHDCHDDVVIYTGYYETEIQDRLDILKHYDNITVKFGRFKPDQESHFDEVLGVNLANTEQYAIKLS